MAIAFIAVIVAAFLLPVFVSTKRKRSTSKGFQVSPESVSLKTSWENKVKNDYMVAVGKRCYQKSENDQLKNMQRAYKLFKKGVLTEKEYQNVLADIKIAI